MVTRYVGSNYTETAPAANARQCPKCGGTGFFCLGIENDAPISNTGFDCFKCEGSGWVIPQPRRRRCPGCGFLRTAAEMEQGHAYSVVENGEQRFYECEPKHWAYD